MITTQALHPIILILLVGEQTSSFLSNAAIISVPRFLGSYVSYVGQAASSCIFNPL